MRLPRLQRVAIAIVSLVTVAVGGLLAISSTPVGAQALRGVAQRLEIVASTLGPLAVLAGGEGGCGASGPSSGPGSGPCPPPPCPPNGGFGGGGFFNQHNTTTVKIGSPAVLVGGCTVYVPITYSCFPPPFGYPAFGSISVSQTLPGNGGSGSFTPICDDKQQKQSVPAFGMFSPGAAAASAVICGFECNGASREIRIVLK